MRLLLPASRLSAINTYKPVIPASLPTRGVPKMREVRTYRPARAGAQCSAALDTAHTVRSCVLYVHTYVSVPCLLCAALAHGQRVGAVRSCAVHTHVNVPGENVCACCVSATGPSPLHSQPSPIWMPHGTPLLRPSPRPMNAGAHCFPMRGAQQGRHHCSRTPLPPLPTRDQQSPVATATTLQG